MYCYIYIPSKPPLGLASLTLPPSRLGIAQASLALLSTWRRLKKGGLVANFICSEVHKINLGSLLTQNG